MESCSWLVVGIATRRCSSAKKPPSSKYFSARPMAPSLVPVMRFLASFEATIAKYHDPPHAKRGEVPAQRAEGSWASSLLLMTPPALRATSPTSLGRKGRQGGQNADIAARRFHQDRRSPLPQTSHPVAGRAGQGARRRTRVPDGERHAQSRDRRSRKGPARARQQVRRHLRQD